MQKRYYNYKKLAHILLDKDMSQKDLSKLSGVSVSSIGKMNAGEPISFRLLWKIADCLGCSDINELFEIEMREEHENPDSVIIAKRVG